MRYNSDYERERESGYDPRYGGRRESAGQSEEDFDREYQGRFPGRGDRVSEYSSPGQGRSSRPNGSPWLSGSPGGGGRNVFDSYDSGSQAGSAWPSSSGERPRSQSGSGGFGSGSYGSRGFGEDSRGFDAGQYGGGNYGSSTYGTGSQGQFAGKGPKGYKRSDERLIEDISERLSDHPRIDASEIEVRIEEGIAILTGTVSDRQCKRLAEEISESVSGVRDVRNELRLQSNASQDSDPQSRGIRKDSQSETGRSEMSPTAKRG